MTDSTYVIAAADLERLVLEVFAKAGFRAADAQKLSDVLIWADLCGHESHGVARIKRYLDFVRRGDLDSAASPSIVKDLGALIHIDGHKAAGPVCVNFGTDAAIAAARRFGSAWAIVGHTTHAGPIGYYMERIARAGLIGVAFAAGSPLMAYYGSASASVSTSPIAIGVPSAGPFPFVIDMATSVAANGKLMQAARRGTAIPEGWALDAAGRPTVDPKQAAVILPVGGPKGSGLSLAFEMICSLGAGAPILQVALRGQAPHVQNAAVCAIDIGQLCDLVQFRAEVSDLITLIKNQPRADGVEEILAPGERSGRTAARRRTEGLPLPRALIDELKQLASA